MADAQARARLAGLGGRTILVLALLVVGVAAAQRAGWRLDASADRRFSLDPRLAELLAAQREPVELIEAWSPRGDDTPLDADRLRELDDALTRMARAGSEVRVARIDPPRERHLVDAFAAKYGRFGGPGIYVARGARARKIALNDGTRLGLQREVAGALAALADPRPPTIRLAQGHGELSPDGGDERDRALADALGVAGFAVTPLAPLEAPRPDDIVLVAGATAPFGRDLAALEDHLRDGGAALVLADDRVPDDLARALAKRGVLLGAMIPQALLTQGVSAIGDPAAAPLPPRLLFSREHHDATPGQDPFGDLRFDAAMLDPNHPATAGVARSGRAVVAPQCAVGFALSSGPGSDEAGLAAARQRLGATASDATPLARTADDVWTARRGEPLVIPPRRKTLPQSVAWAVTCAPPDGSVRTQSSRLVVWTSRALAADAWCGRDDLADADVLVDCARWLAGRGPAEDIPPRETAAYRVGATSDALTAWIAALVAVLPSALIGGAILAWWERR